MSGGDNCFNLAMPGLVPGIHVFKTARHARRGWPESLAMTIARLSMSLLSKISTHTDERSARLAGIGLMIFSVFMFSFGDALGKYMVATYSVGQLLWLRACNCCG